MKKDREEIALLDQQLKQIDMTHEQEIEDLQHQHKRERERLRERIQALEKVLVKYDISFTLIAHPEVKVENLKVIGKEDVLESQKVRTISAEPKNKK